MRSSFTTPTVKAKELVPWALYPQGQRNKLSAEECKTCFPFRDNLNQAVCLWKGNITHLQVDGIMNAANEGLCAGGGICGAIHSAAGPELSEACMKIGSAPVRCRTGETVITPGFSLQARYVLHTVGPTCEDAEKLQSCYSSTLNVAAESGLCTVALCCLSTGIFGYPLVNATHVALDTVRCWLQANPGKLDRIIFTVFSSEEQKVYEHMMVSYFPWQNAPQPQRLEFGVMNADAAYSCFPATKSQYEALSGSNDDNSLTTSASQP